MCMGFLLACMCVCAMCAWCLQRLEEGIIDVLELELQGRESPTI